MKVTTIIGTAIAAVGLAACGSTAVTPPTAQSTLSLAVAPTAALTTAPTATPIPTPTATPCGDYGALVACGTPPPTATPTPTPSASPSASPNDSPSASPTPACWPGCGTGWNTSTTCALAGGDGTLTITWVTGDPPNPPNVPATITVDGNVLTVTGNPFTFPLTVGTHGWLAFPDFVQYFTITACDVVTVTATCSAADNPSADATFSGVTVGDYLNIEESTYGTLITSNPFVMHEIPAATGLTYVETSGEVTVASGTFNVAACPGKTIR